MARAQVPTVDPRDPDAVRRALRAIELILQQHGDAVDLLLAQRATVPIEQTGRAPDNAPVPTGITTTFNQDGSMTVELQWTYAQGARPSTQTVIIIKKGAAPLKVPVYWEDDVYTVPSGATYARIDLPSEHNYRFGVAVARGTPSGLEVGPVQAPTANPDWADIGGTAPVIDIGGLVKGVRLSVPSDVTLTESTFVAVGTVTIDIPAWATDTKALITASLNMGLTTTTHGVFQIQWQILRGATQIVAANNTRFDSAVVNASQWFMHVAPWMDATTLTGSVVYTLNLRKANLTGSNAVVVRAASQVAVMHWSYK